MTMWMGRCQRRLVLLDAFTRERQIVEPADRPVKALTNLLFRKTTGAGVRITPAQGREV
jgi:hypothetical protein